MKLSKNKVAGGVLGLLAIVSIVNTQAIVKLTNFVSADPSRLASFDFAKQTAQVVNSSTKTTEGTVYKRGDKSEVILQVQKALTSKGIYKGDISGLIGPRTEKAISDFQKLNGISITGALDQKTIDHILRGGGVRPTTNPGATVLPACTRNSEPWIRVTSPNGGEVYQAGQEINVTWAKCNVPAGIDVGITLLNEISGQPLPTFVNHVQIEQTPNDGSQIISASAMQGLLPFEYGTRFKVMLNYVVTSSYDWQTYGNNPAWMQNVDESNNSFTITGEEGCIEGTLIGFSSSGNPIFCGGEGLNVHFGTSACGMEVLTPNPEVSLYGLNSSTFTALIKLENVAGLDCGWAEFEGMPGGVELIDIDSGLVLASQISNSDGGSWQFVSIGDPQTYTTDRYYLATLQFVNPLPSNLSNNIVLYFVENNENGGSISSLDRLYMPINVIQ